MFTQLRRSMPSACTWAPSHKSPAALLTECPGFSHPGYLCSYKYSCINIPKQVLKTAPGRFSDGSCFQTLQLITVWGLLCPLQGALRSLPLFQWVYGQVQAGENLSHAIRREKHFCDRRQEFIRWFWTSSLGFPIYVGRESYIRNSFLAHFSRGCFWFCVKSLPTQGCSGSLVGIHF